MSTEGLPSWAAAFHTEEDDTRHDVPGPRSMAALPDPFRDILTKQELKSLSTQGRTEEANAQSRKDTASVGWVELDQGITCNKVSGVCDEVGWPTPGREQKYTAVTRKLRLVGWLGRSGRKSKLGVFPLSSGCLLIRFQIFIASAFRLGAFVSDSF